MCLIKVVICGFIDVNYSVSTEQHDNRDDRRNNILFEVIVIVSTRSIHSVSIYCVSMCLVMRKIVAKPFLLSINAPIVEQLGVLSFQVPSDVCYMFQNVQKYQIKRQTCHVNYGK